MASPQRKVVLVTGGGTGIGQATAVEFIKKDYNVVVTGRRKEKLEATVSMCEAEGATKDRILAVDGDIVKPEDNQRWVNETINTFGKLDCLVNNAGIIHLESFESSTLEHMDEQYNIMVRGVFDLTQKAMPHLLKSKGNVVIVSSVFSLQANTGFVSYSMMKACIDHFARAISVEYAPKGVRINTVNPAFTRTGILDKPLPEKTEKEIDDVFASLSLSQPNGVCQKPVDLARVITFLASDDASFITGANVPADGGWRNALGNSAK